MGREFIFLRIVLARGGREFCLYRSILVVLNRVLRFYVVYFVEGVFKWNRLGTGTGMNLIRTRL